MLKMLPSAAPAAAAVAAVTAIGLAACSANAPARCTIAPPALTTGRLRADGTRLRDASHDSDNGAAYLDAHFAAFDALGLHGTEWEYSVAAEPWNAEPFSIAAADGSAYPIAAALARPYARAVAGDAITAAYDPTTKTYSLAYTADGGVTDVSLPRAFASADVQLTGACIDDTHAGTLFLRGTGPVTLRLRPR
jgi:Glycoside hydrolase family 5 C-terminal domain